MSNNQTALQCLECLYNMMLFFNVPTEKAEVGQRVPDTYVQKSHAIYIIGDYLYITIPGLGPLLGKKKILPNFYDFGKIEDLPVYCASLINRHVEKIMASIAKYPQCQKIIITTFSYGSCVGYGLGYKLRRSAKLAGVYTFGSPAFFPYSSCAKYNETLGDLTHSYKSLRDPIFDFGGFATLTGRLLCYLLTPWVGYIKRGVPGTHVILCDNCNIWKVKHSLSIYINYIRLHPLNKCPTAHYASTKFSYTSYFQMFFVIWDIFGGVQNLTTISTVFLGLAAPLLLVAAVTWACFILSYFLN